jgi:RNA polymerase sigma-70 factor (ECF subfamily)
MKQEEQALLRALHRGERRACDDLVKRYSRQVYNIALRLTSRPEEAEDVLQETFINACRGAENFEGRSSLGTWLYRIATNNGLMRLRRRRVETVPLELPPDEELADFQPRHLQDWSWNPESLVLTDELRQAMDEGIDSLPEPLRAVFVLRDIEGLSTNEAAEVLDISPGNLKVRLHRARLLLREYLAAYFNEKVQRNGGHNGGHKDGQ